MNIIDWKRVTAFIKERKPVEVSAGILNDWYWTAATVYENGRWVPGGRANAYTTSDWATPGFKATMPNGDVIEVDASKKATKAEETAQTRRTVRRLAKARKIIDRIAKKRRRLAFTPQP